MRLQMSAIKMMPVKFYLQSDCIFFRKQLKRYLLGIETHYFNNSEIENKSIIHRK